MNVKTVFGLNLKQYRKEKNLSQEQLAEKADISVKHLSEIERGIVFASAGLLKKLAESLEVPVFAFFLTGNSVYYDTVMLNRIEKTIIQSIGQTMQEIKLGHLQ
jgi:transcriptional regulator with XRE-family HTH domain